MMFVGAILVASLGLLLFRKNFETAIDFLQTNEGKEFWISKYEKNPIPIESLSFLQNFTNQKENRRYYFFITDYEYLNDNTTQVTIMADFGASFLCATDGSCLAIFLSD